MTVLFISILFLFLKKMDICIFCECLSEYMPHVNSVLGSHKRASDSLLLEVQVIMSHSKWVLEVRLRLSGRS